MGPFLDQSLLPKTLDKLNREMKIIEELIREQKDKLKEAHEQKTKTLKKFYVLESTRDNRESEVNKLISKIELELYKLDRTYKILESNRWRYGDATKQVESVGTSPVEMTPLPKQKSKFGSFLKSLTNRRSSASKPHTGGRKTRRQRTRRAH
jgi:hypothetical protein